MMQILHLNPNDGFIAHIYHASLQQFLPQPFLFMMGVARKMMSSWLQLSLITTSVTSSTARVLLASCGPASFILLCIMPRLFFVWPSLCKRTRANCRLPGKLEKSFTKIAFCNGGGNHVTCCILEQEANTLTQANMDNKGLCSGYRELGSILCGCPERPTALKQVPHLPRW
jgi:hypothetical protein